MLGILQFFRGNSTRVEARDIDGPGLNSEISYDKEGEDSDKFSVDKDTGIVTVAPGQKTKPLHVKVVVMY